MGVTKNSVRKYREVLIEHGLIKKMYKRRLPDGNYQTNLYEIVRSEDLLNPEQKEGEQMWCKYVNSCNNLNHDKFALGVVQIWNDFNDSVFIFAPGVVQYFSEGGSNLDP